MRAAESRVYASSHGDRVRGPGESERTMWCLDSTLDRVASHLESPLADAAALSRARLLAQRLPASLTRRVHLESWLRATPSRLDVIVRIDVEQRDLLAAASFLPPRTASVQTTSWRRIVSLARAWQARGSRLERDIKGMWLEFDLVPGETVDFALWAPRLFVDFHHEAQQEPSVERRLQLALAALRAACGGTVDPGMVEGLRACLSHLPEGATVPYLGLSLRDEPVVRVCARGLGRGLGDYLCGVGWPGNVQELRDRVLSPLARARPDGAEDVSLLHLDLSPEVASRVGLEYTLDRVPQLRGEIAEGSFLDELVARGWCDAEGRQALQHWPGRSLELLPHELWLSQLTRRLSHVKVTYAGADAVAAKAYLCFFHDLQPGGAVVGTRPRRFDALPRPVGAPAPSNGAGVRLGGDHGVGAAPYVVGRARSCRVLRFGPPVAREKARILGGVSMTIPAAQQQALEKILERATVNVDFRRALLTDPARAIYEAFGVKIPQGFRVKFMEKSADVDALVVLPDLQRPDGELSERDLAVVAGGGGKDPEDPW